MSCDEDLEGMVVDLSFEGVADEREEGAERLSHRGPAVRGGDGGGGRGGEEGTRGKRGGSGSEAIAGRGSDDTGGGGEREHQQQAPSSAARSPAPQRVGRQQKPRAQEKQQPPSVPAGAAAASAAALPPGVEDIDVGVQDEGDSHLLNPDYVKEHAAFLRKQEKRNRPTDYIRAKQKDMRSSMRSVLVDWICEVCDQFKLSSRTLFQVRVFFFKCWGGECGVVWTHHIPPSVRQAYIRRLVAAVAGGGFACGGRIALGVSGTKHGCPAAFDFEVAVSIFWRSIFFENNLPSCVHVA